jgi:hypothetical protein
MKVIVTRFQTKEIRYRRARYLYYKYRGSCTIHKEGNYLGCVFSLFSMYST